MKKDKADPKQELEEIIKRHGKSLAKYIELIGKEEFEKELEELIKKNSD